MVTLIKAVFLLAFATLSKPQMMEEDIIALEHQQLDLELEELDVEKLQEDGFEVIPTEEEK